MVSCVGFRIYMMSKCLTIKPFWESWEVSWQFWGSNPGTWTCYTSTLQLSYIWVPERFDKQIQNKNAGLKWPTKAQRKEQDGEDGSLEGRRWVRRLSGLLSVGRKSCLLLRTWVKGKASGRDRALPGAWDVYRALVRSGESRKKDSASKTRWGSCKHLGNTGCV